MFVSWYNSQKKGKEKTKKYKTYKKGLLFLKNEYNSIRRNYLKRC